MTRLMVSGAGFAPYEILVQAGLLNQAGSHLAPFVTGGRAVIVSDDTVAAHYGDSLLTNLIEAGLKASLIAVPPGEASKSWNELERLIDQLLDMDLDRKDLLIALGGGVVGDLTGFAAAIYKRGIDFVQIPTSLLAQVDSSVGGKTAIDTRAGKNLVGAFHQPRLVLCDLDVLFSLPDRELKAGLAEVIKYGVLGDLAFVDWLEAHAEALLDRDLGALEYAIARSVAMKAEIVGEDEKEAGRRALLNLGHTFGHALETETGMSATLLHGEAVAIGMAQAMRFSVQLGLCPPSDADRVIALLKRFGLPTTMAEVRNQPFDAHALLSHMGQDKKAERGQLVFILNDRLGASRVIKGIAPDQVLAFLRDEGAVTL